MAERTVRAAGLPSPASAVTRSRLVAKSASGSCASMDSRVAGAAGAAVPVLASTGDCCASAGRASRASNVRSSLLIMRSCRQLPSGPARSRMEQSHNDHPKNLNKGDRPLTLLSVVLSRALLRGLVVVAALQRDPVGIDVLAARQEVRPGVARHCVRRLPYHVELAVRAHLANQHRLGQ